MTTPATENQAGNWKMLEISRDIRIPDGEFHWSFVRAGGPGGQNVNKVASKAVLRWNVVASPSLPLDVKTRLLARHGGRITVQGDLLIVSQRFRDQERNRHDCLAKVRHLIGDAAKAPKPRKATRRTRGSQEARLKTKKQRSALKARRRRPSEE